MTDNEIIKALVHCDISHQCEGCPRDFDTNGEISCMKLGEDILALINRQKEEIERLKRSLDNMTDALIRTDDYYRDLECKGGKDNDRIH